jgi:hypothetical protein
MQKVEFPNWTRYAIVIVVIIAAYISIKHQNKNQNDLEARGRYIVGVTKGTVTNHRSSKTAIDYSYPYNGNTYQSSMHESSVKGIKTVGGKYLVIFDPQNPKNSKMLFDKEVEYTTLINFADTGWTKIPDFVILKK